MKQRFKMRSGAGKDVIMDPKLRIVQCPKCKAYLQEPPVGNPFYECGSCFTTLQAIHATQEDVERRLHQKALFKRMEIDKNAKSVSSEDGYKVFTSESSSEKSLDREEHGHSREGSPSWSPSRWESPLYGPKSGPSSQQQTQPQQPQVQHQRKAAESSEKSPFNFQGEPARTKQDFPQDKVDALGQNLQQLRVEDNDEMKHQNRASTSYDWANGHGTQHLSMRRPRPEELHHEKDGEGHQPHGNLMQKSVSFNDAGSRQPAPAHLERSPSFSDDINNQGSRSDTEETAEDSIHHILDDFLSARYEVKPQYSKVEGYEIQRDMYTAPDVAEYGTSSHTSSVGDGDAHHAPVMENQSKPHSGEPDSYVVLDHRQTRPGSYHRTSSSSRHGQPNTAHHHSADCYDRNNPDGEKLSPRTHSASMTQQRPMPYHLQQPSHVTLQSTGQSPPRYVYNKPPVAQNQYVFHETASQTSQNGTPKSYPFLPRPDEPQIVQCQHCEQLLGVPANLPPPKKAYQKLLCGACGKISIFLLAVVEEYVPSPTISPRGHAPYNDFSTVHIPSPPDSGSRHVNHVVKSEPEGGDRGYSVVAPGPSQRLPPLVRNIPRVPSGSKISAMTSGTSGTGMMGHVPVSNGVSNLHPASGAMPTRASSSSHYGDGKPYRRSYSAYGPSGEHIMSTLGPRASAGSDYEGHHPHEGRHFQTSSESDNDSPRMRPPMNAFKGEQFQVSSRMPLDRHVAQQYSKDEGYMHETNLASSMSLKGIVKKGAKDPTKPKDSGNNLYRRKVTVNGAPIPDALVKRAEGSAGPIYPGSYWYDPHAGFWGVLGGPCMGIIPPRIEELSIQPLARNCSGGQTGVLVNGRELHKGDYDLLVRRGLPPTPGKSYFVDIEGHVKEATSGYELRGLGPLAPTLDQTSRGQGMRIPGQVA